MSKTKTSADKAAATAESAIANSAEALKAGFDKAVKNYDLVLGYGKDTAEAVMKSATVAGKGVETLTGEAYAYSRQSLEDSITATKAVLGAKSLHEAFEYQGDYAKRLSNRMSANSPASARFSPPPPRTASRRCKAASKPGSTSSRPPAPDRVSSEKSKGPG